MNLSALSVTFAICLYFCSVLEMGDDISDIYGDGTLVICNHQSTGDVPVMMHCLQNKGDVLNRILWIMDSLFKPTHFGWVSQFREDFFIKQVS